MECVFYCNSGICPRHSDFPPPFALFRIWRVEHLAHHKRHGVPALGIVRHGFCGSQPQVCPLVGDENNIFGQIICRHRQKSLYLHPNFELKLADKRRSIVSHTQDKHLRQPKAVVCRGQHKRLSTRHLPHGTRQFQVVVGLFQDSVLTQPSEAELTWKFENKNTWGNRGNRGNRVTVISRASRNLFLLAK